MRFRKAIGHPLAGKYCALLNLLIVLFTIYIGFKMPKRKWTGMLLGVLAVIAFVVTENLYNPMQIVDKWTLPMLLISTMTWIIGSHEILMRHNRG